MTHRIIGVESSPYAVKVRAVMRYRRLPYVWVSRMPQFYEETQGVRPLIMPVVQFPDGSYRTDSTPIILELETAYPGARSVIPDDPGLAFLSALVEDFADEWLTKCLFNSRFRQAKDQLSGAAWVMDDAFPGLDRDTLRTRIAEFIERQVARMPLVGCTPANTPLIDASYLALLDAMESFAATERFLFGTRPSLGDFGLYGQLNTLAVDPTAGALMRDRAPRTANWVRRLADASGVEGDWYSSLEQVPAALKEILRIVGVFYLPFLAANRSALAEGLDEFEVILDGLPFRQAPYRYQGKCYDYLLSQFPALPAASRAAIEPLLSETDCLRCLARAGPQIARSLGH